MYINLNVNRAFTSAAIIQWAQASLTHGARVYSNGLACLNIFFDARHLHMPMVVGSLKVLDLSSINWGNIVLCNLKTTLVYAFHSLKFSERAGHCLSAFACRLNRRVNVRRLVAPLIIYVVPRMSVVEQTVRLLVEAIFSSENNLTARTL